MAQNYQQPLYEYNGGRVPQIIPPLPPHHTQTRRVHAGVDSFQNTEVQYLPPNANYHYHAQPPVRQEVQASPQYTRQQSDFVHGVSTLENTPHHSNGSGSQFYNLDNSGDAMQLTGGELTSSTDQDRRSMMQSNTRAVMRMSPLATAAIDKTPASNLSSPDSDMSTATTAVGQQDLSEMLVSMRVAIVAEIKVLMVAELRAMMSEWHAAAENMAQAEIKGNQEKRDKFHRQLIGEIHKLGDKQDRCVTTQKMEGELTCFRHSAQIGRIGGLEEKIEGVHQYLIDMSNMHIPTSPDAEETPLSAVSSQSLQQLHGASNETIVINEAPMGKSKTVTQRKGKARS